MNPAIIATLAQIRARTASLVVEQSPISLPIFSLHRFSWIFQARRAENVRTATLPLREIFKPLGASYGWPYLLFSSSNLALASLAESVSPYLATISVNRFLAWSGIPLAW